MLAKLRKAQSTAEYAILLSLVLFAAMGIQNEVRRAIQSRIHDAAMELSGGKQYEPAQGFKQTDNQVSERTKTENYIDGNNPDKAWIVTDESSRADYHSVTVQ
jgi:hypothetical protein